VRVQAQGEQPLRAGLTDDEGLARFETVDPSPAYSIRAQKVDYALALLGQGTVPKGRVTRVTMALTPHAGERLFVGLDAGGLTEIDTASPLIVRTLVFPGEQPGAVRHLLIHPGEDLLYAIVRGRSILLDRDSGAHVGSLAIRETGDGQDPIQTWGLTGDGQRLLVLGRDAAGPHWTLDALTGDSISETWFPELSFVPHVFC